MSNKFKITAWMLCHDLKFNEYISTFVEAESFPPEQEVRKLLELAANEILQKYQGAGKHFELLGVNISKL